MNEKFESILHKHGIYGEDTEEILYAVSDMLEFMMNRTKQEEPYAHNAIKRMETAMQEVSALAWNLYDI